MCVHSINLVQHVKLDDLKVEPLGVRRLPQFPDLRPDLATRDHIVAASREA
jgi:hypothetical protein